MARKRIEFRHLHAFVEVSNQRHFTRAAETLAISQPALSSLIAQLEQDLGTQLLVRTTRSVELTPAGREFLPSASRIVGDLLHSIQEVQDYSQLRRGRLRIAALPSLCTILLPQAAKIFAERHPDISISIVDVVGDEVVDRVMRRQVDIGIGYVSATDMIAAEPVLKDRLVAVGTREMLGGRSALSWADLSGFGVIAMSEGTTVRRLIEQGCREAGIKPDIVLQAYQMPTAIAYARNGLGIAILPSSSVPDEAEDIVWMDIEAPLIERQLAVIRTRDNPITPPASAFLKVLSELRAS